MFLCWNKIHSFNVSMSFQKLFRTSSNFDLNNQHKQVNVRDDTLFRMRIRIHFQFKCVFPFHFAIIFNSRALFVPSKCEIIMRKYVINNIREFVNEKKSMYCCTTFHHPSVKWFTFYSCPISISHVKITYN